MIISMFRILGSFEIAQEVRICETKRINFDEKLSQSFSTTVESTELKIWNKVCPVEGGHS